MTLEEREKLSVELCRMWPKKFGDEELEDWGQRLRKFHIDDILKALDEHKNTSKFRPQVSEIFAKLKGKERGDATYEPVEEGSWFDVIRRREPWLAGRPDREVALRHWRALWFRKKGMIDAKLASVAALEARAKRKTPDDTKLLAGFALARELFVADLAGFRVAATQGLVMSLMSAGMEEEAAERCTLFLFEESVEHARMMLADVLQMDEKGEPIDAFA